MRWHAETESLEAGHVQRFRVRHGGAMLSYAQAIAYWQNDRDFCSFFAGLLAGAPYPAYFWETPPVTSLTASQPFEFILAESAALADMPPDAAAFARHFRAAGTRAQVAAFDNLGGDAFLVAPCPHAPFGPYPHLAAFSRCAPAAQQLAFWQAVGASLAARLAERPLWLSTSGLGVAWLHARLDTWPKYYTFAPYRQRT